MDADRLHPAKPGNDFTYQFCKQAYVLDKFVLPGIGKFFKWLIC